MDLQRPNEHDQTCKPGYRICGAAGPEGFEKDTLRCILDEDECPINFLEFTDLPGTEDVNNKYIKLTDLIYLHIKRDAGNLPISQFTLTEEEVCLDYREYETAMLYPLMKNKLRYTGCDFEIKDMKVDKLRWKKIGG